MPDVSPKPGGSRETQFEDALALYGAALERLARAYEADADPRRDLLQEIFIALWRSLTAFDGRCSLRTWVYRVAHNTAASHVAAQIRRSKRTFVGLDELAELPDHDSGEAAAGERDAIGRLYALIEQLKPLDRQVMLAYLEGIDAAATAEITGLSPGNVAVKIHRIKQLLARRLNPKAQPATAPAKEGAR